MNQKAQSLTHPRNWFAAGALITATATLATLVSASSADEAATAKTTADEAAAAAPAAEAAVAGPVIVSDAAASELLNQVRAKLEGLDSLQCELQQSAVINGMKLMASGRYLEASGNRVRLEFTIYPAERAKAVDGKTPELVEELPARADDDNRGVLSQISDGTVLHTSWKNGETTRVTRRNIRDILAASLTLKNYEPQHAAMDLGIGGLRGLIARLQTTMDFAPTKTVNLAGRDYIEVTGRWNLKIRREVFQVADDVVVLSLPQIPEYVRLFIDAESMLPRRIMYLKRSFNAEDKTVRPLLTLDIRKLKLNEPVADDLFVYQPPENVVEDDQTAMVIKAIEEASKLAIETPAASSSDAPVAPDAAETPKP